MKEGITHILAKVSVYDEWFDEGADCVLFPIEYLAEVEKTRKELKRIKDGGIDAAVIELYVCPTWIDTMCPVTAEFAEKILVYDSNEFMDLDFDGYDKETPANDEDEVEGLIGIVSTNIDRLGVSESCFYLHCNIKHTEIEMGVTIWDNQVNLDSLPTLAEVLRRQEENA